MTQRSHHWFMLFGNRSADEVLDELAALQVDPADYVAGAVKRVLPPNSRDAYPVYQSVCYELGVLP